MFETRLPIFIVLVGLASTTSACASLNPWSKPPPDSPEHCRAPASSASQESDEPTSATSRPPLDVEGSVAAVSMAGRTVEASRRLARLHGARAAVRLKRGRSPQIVRNASDSQTNGGKGTTSSETSGGRSPSTSDEGEGPDDEPSYRKIQRSGHSSPKPSEATWPRSRSEGQGKYAAVDVTLDDHVLSLDDEDSRQTLEKTYRIDSPESDASKVLTGRFSKDEDRTQQVAVVQPGRRIRVYAAGQIVARANFEDLGPLPERLRAVEPVRIVRDGTVQLLFCWTEQGEKNEIRYKAGVFKVIGTQLGRIFERTVATRSSKDGELKRRGYFEFLHGDEHRFIRWTPADEDGQPTPEEAVILHWNHWEGVYRRPIPPPTAPDQQS